MKPATILALAKGANDAYKYIRKADDKNQRDIYSSLLAGLKRDGDLDDLHDKLNPEELERLYGAARANAGDITRDMHDRLDRRRANFTATAPARKAYREQLLQQAEGKKKEGSSFIGTAAKWTLGLTAAAGGAWALWEFLLKDKLDGGADSGAKTYTPAPKREEADGKGGTTLVYSTRTEDDREAGIQDGGVHPAEAGEGRWALSDAEIREREAREGGKHELLDDDAAGNLASDQGRDGLSTLDTLADDQRKATKGGDN